VTTAAGSAAGLSAGSGGAAPAGASRRGSANGAGGPIRVTQARVIRSEWTKLLTLRSTLWSLLAAIVLTVGLGALICLARGSNFDRESPVERLLFDPTATSLVGLFLSQLAIGVLGVLVMSGEYATGMVRSTFAAVPHRLPVLWAKAIVFSAVSFVLMTAASLGAFLAGQAVFSHYGLGTSLGAHNVLRAVIGGGLYLTVIGLLGIGLGALLRRTAVAIAVLFGVLLVLPIIVNFLPSSFKDPIQKYLPSSAGQSILQVVHDPSSLSPWAGFAVMLAYAVVVLAVAAFFLLRRDV